MQTFFQNGDEQINGDRAPDLGAHGVRTGAIKGFDAQMLFDPFEEQFDLPAAPIQLSDGQSRHSKIVGQEDQPLAGFGIAIADTSQRIGILVLGTQTGPHHGLVKAQTGGFGHGPGVAAGAAEVFLGAGDKESPGLMEAMEPGEVEIAAIHDIEGTGFPDQLVEDVDVVNTARRDNDDGGKVALQGQQRVQFDGGLVPPKRGPRKQREAQVNGGGVQRIGSGLEFQAERFIGVERGGLLNEDVGKVGEDAPVAFFVGIGQRAAGSGLPDAGVIEFGAEGRQTGFDVAQTFAPRQLGERQHEKLFISGQFADAEVAVVTSDTLVELIFGETVEELGEDGATFVHKVKNRRNAGNHPQGIVAELKSKKGKTAKTHRFYRIGIAVSENLTGQ